MIQFIENKNNKIIPFARSKSLCSFQRPLSEAQSWYRLYNLKGQTEVCILGAGGGFHIYYVSLLHPHMNIVVYDFNIELLETIELQFKDNPKIKFVPLRAVESLGNLKEIQDYLQMKLPVIMPFRPGWQGHEELFSTLLLKMTQREVSTLKEFWKQESAPELTLNWNMLHEEKNFLTLKNLLQASDYFSSFDEKVLHVFDEIIK